MSKKSRFGCQTCKTRRVKCDETLPFCRRCVETGRQCDGPSKHNTIFIVSTPSQRQITPSTNPGSNSSISPPTQLTVFPGLQDSGKRALSFFIECAGPALGGDLDQEFWHSSLLRLCHQNPMVRNAVLTVSTLYEKPLSNPLSWPTSVEANFHKPEHRQAFRWYSQSLSGMSEALSQSENDEQLQVALTTSILFACVEFQQLNVVNSMHLMKCGYSLLGQEIARTSMAHSPLIRHILLPIFIRQTIILLLHGYPLPRDWLPPDLLSQTPDTISISSLQDARTHLFLLMFEVFHIITAAYVTYDPTQLAYLHQARSTLEFKLEIWRSQTDIYVNFIHLCSATSDSPINTLSPLQQRTISLLEIYYLIAKTWLSACLIPTEQIWDTFTPQFLSILQHVETVLSLTTNSSSITYTFEMGLIPPLYFVAWRCRIPNLRRHALRLLRRAPAQESLFHRDVQIWAARKIIEIEEGFVPGVSGEDIEDVPGFVPPEEARLRHVLVRWDVSGDDSGNTNAAPEPKNTNGGAKSRPHLVYSRWFLREDEHGQIREVKPCVAEL